jgi:hypothetical protein
MEDANAHSAPLAFKQKRLPVHLVAFPQRLVDKEVFAVKPADRRRLVTFGARKQHPIVVLHLLPVMENADGRGNDLMAQFAVGEAGQYPVDVVRGLKPEVVVYDLVHLCPRKSHRLSPPA